MTNLLPPDGSWADPLTRAERRELARRLADYAHRFYGAAPRYRTGSDSRDKLYAAGNEMGDLHLDVTERAATPPPAPMSPLMQGLYEPDTLPDRCAFHGGEGDGGEFCDECRQERDPFGASAFRGHGPGCGCPDCEGARRDADDGDHADCGGPVFGEAELRRADAYRDHAEEEGTDHA